MPGDNDNRAEDMNAQTGAVNTRNGDASDGFGSAIHRLNGPRLSPGKSSPG